MPPGIAAFTTLRHGAGISRPPFDSFNLGTRHGADGDDPDAIAHNRGQLLERFGLPSPPRWLRQVHGTGVANLDVLLPACGKKALQSDEVWLDDELRADAAVTRRPGIVLAVLTADCLPVVFAAADGSEVAVAHAGWRGLS
ncbi:MAG: laccase domain-containing protein, partial [Gammaproteobacteria bacterium]|nr:laccase domain-containing protein [Gammaproteobacteria bacterium]